FPDRRDAEAPDIWNYSYWRPGAGLNRSRFQFPGFRIRSFVFPDHKPSGYRVGYWQFSAQKTDCRADSVRLLSVPKHRSGPPGTAFLPASGPRSRFLPGEFLKRYGSGAKNSLQRSAFLPRPLSFSEMWQKPEN